MTCPALGAAGSRGGRGLSSRRRPGSFTTAAMLDFFTIFSKGGLVLWCFQGVSDSCTGPVNALIRSVLLQVPPPLGQDSGLIPRILSTVPLDLSRASLPPCPPPQTDRSLVAGTPLLSPARQTVRQLRGAPSRSPFWDCSLLGLPIVPSIRPWQLVFLLFPRLGEIMDGKTSFQTVNSVQLPVDLCI